MSKPIFIGTEKDFNNFFGGYSRNLVQSITRKHKKEINKCEHCGISEVQLDSAHISGKERKIIISNILKFFKTEDNLLSVPLIEFEKKFINQHQPISEVIKILCKPCHLKYDKVDSYLDFETTSVIQNNDNSVNRELHKVNYFEYARLTFSKSLIEPLNLEDDFSIHVTSTNETFTFSKREFFTTFNNVVNSNSYKIKGIYSYTKIPQKTYAFLSNRRVRKKNNDNLNLKIVKQLPTIKNEEAIKPIKLKIGKYVQSTFRKVILKIDNNELVKLQIAAYSKITFDIQYPLLKKVLRTDTGKIERYWKEPVEILGDKYWLCSEWFEKDENNDRSYYEKWLKKIGYNDN